MVADIINEFRNTNGKERIFCWDPVENDYCLEHCLYMAKTDKVEHALKDFLKGKAEAIAMCLFDTDINTTARYLIFSVLNASEEHRNILLNYDNLAYGIYMDNYKMYLTLRGW